MRPRLRSGATGGGTAHATRGAISFLVLHAGIVGVSLFAAAGAGAAGTRVARHSNFRLGVNMHPLQDAYAPETVAQQVRLAAETGAQLLRVDVHWAWLEPNQPGDWNTSQVQRLEAFLSEARARGLAIVATVLETPCWAADDPEDCARHRAERVYPPRSASDFAAFLSELGRRYGDDIEAWEVWNEPNLDRFWHPPDPIRYSELLRAARAALEASDPDSVVLGGSLAPTSDIARDGRDTLQYLEAMYRAGAKGAFDGLALHSYTDGQPPDFFDSRWPMHSFTRLAPAVRDTMSAHGDDAPIWITEVGWTTVAGCYRPGCWSDALPVTEAAQARYLAESVRMAHGWDGVAGYIWYELVDMPRPPTPQPPHPEHFFGLYRADLSPKPAAGEFRRLAEELGAPPTPTRPRPTETPTASPSPTSDPTPRPPTVRPTTPVPSSTPTTSSPTSSPTPLDRDTPSVPGAKAYLPLALRAAEIWSGTPEATNPPPSGPFRSHERTSIGSGVFDRVTYSDGMAPYSEAWLRAQGHFEIQRIRREEQPSGCDSALYDVPVVWVSASAPAHVTVNGVSVGEITFISEKQRHGYVAPLRLSRGDEVCMRPVPTSGFHLIFGPDVYYHYDSYCYRGHC